MTTKTLHFHEEQGVQPPARRTVRVFCGPGVGTSARRYQSPAHPRRMRLAGSYWHPCGFKVSVFILR
ncbi:hypothetical protein [Arthrobacter sp. D1-17]